ncbi:ComEC/Rec2 family competence protein [Microbacterium sp. HD4P20]|uniref:ComEC/Rec2 family competence protein n=1 Tax=Microbacterium sp. HD4P20 TaxID=2864874 RepID=UPI001C63E0E5|nr:ComEC/Rec2 family competence protein [Microbacterium sp. HD4P20]MCP2636811.1 ComEC/Rec2 family competence protein [Microbacterium sp. HD4P20]
MNTRLSASLRLVPVAAAAWAAGGAAILLPAAAAGMAVAFWTVAVATTAVLALRTRAARARRDGQAGVRRTALVLVLAAAASAAVASHVALALPAREEAAAFTRGDGRAVAVLADVVGKIERRADGTLAFDATALRWAAGPRMLETRAEVVVRVDPAAVDDLGALDVGARVRVSGTAGPARPGERAIAALWASRGVEVLRAPDGIAGVTAHLRQGLVRSVAGLPGAGAGLVPGLAVGDTSAVTPGLDTAMKESSLSHLTAVSGANCALVVGIAFAGAAAMGAPRAARVGIGVAVLLAFVALVTPEPSVVRAAGMAAIAMLGLLLGRTGTGMAVLSIAVTAALVADPWLAASLGFALSTAATASLLLGARALADGLARAMPRPLALAVAVPLAAQLACGPLLVLIAPQVSLLGVAANLLAGPAAPLTTMLGLAACLTAPLPWMQAGLAALAWLPASWIAAVAGTVSQMPGDLLPWFEGWPGAAALAVVSAAIAAVVVVPGASRRSRRLRLAATVVVASVTGVLLGVGALSSLAGRWTLPADWTVLACDIGQGDAVLVRSAGAVALIDTGPDPETLAACLSRAGIERIDLLVLTHFDIDHAGGVSAVAGRVDTVLHGPPDDGAAAGLTVLSHAGAHVVEASAGLTGSLGDARWRVLWPRAGGTAFPPGNDASVVLDVRGGGIPSMLLLGDLSESPQRALTASGALAAPYEVVKVAHHGSADQDAALYAAADPAVAIFTVGADNTYGHPRDEILDVLTRTGAVVTRTDQDGMIAVWPGDERLSVWRERGG